MNNILSSQYSQLSTLSPLDLITVVFELYFIIKVVGTGTGMVSPNRAPSTVSLSPARVPDVDPIDAAAHLQLLGESLSLIGHRLQETEVSCMRVHICRPNEDDRTD